MKKFELLLEKKGVTIYRVAKETGIPPVTLYEWRSGRGRPKVGTLKKLADYFGVSIEYFLEDDAG